MRSCLVGRLTVLLLQQMKVHNSFSLHILQGERPICQSVQHRPRHFGEGTEHRQTDPLYG